jgi:Sec-independent protein translocase protein TatA
MAETTMNKRWIEDDEGYGIYERIDGNTPMRDVMLAGIYEPVGQVPELSTLLAPLLDVEERSGLVAVKDAVRGTAVAALEMMSFTPSTTGTADPIEGSASFLVGQMGGSGWVTSMSGSGYMVLVNLESVQTGSPQLAATKSAVTIVDRCKRGKGWAMLSGPAQLAIDAMNLATLQVTPSCPAGTIWDVDSKSCQSFACPPPSAWDAIQGRCVAGGGAVVPTPGGTTPTSEKKMASWVLPVALGGGLLVVVGLLVIGQKRAPRPAAMRANKSYRDMTKAERAKLIKRLRELSKKSEKTKRMRSLRKARRPLAKSRKGK